MPWHQTQKSGIINNLTGSISCLNTKVIRYRVSEGSDILVGPHFAWFKQLVMPEHDLSYQIKLSEWLN